MKKINTGEKLLRIAKNIIPGGNQLLSKRSERFLPGLWPSYYKKAKGCSVWDLNNKKFYDFAGMGVTSCVLGYADHDVNKAITMSLKKGAMTSLNCEEEINLAKKLIEIHPWANMSKFARSGGEACAIAIRIARTYSKKNSILFCGYHGWHDWYISSNLSNTRNLDNQLLPGLKSDGIPKKLSNTAIPFEYNNIDSFLKNFKKYKDQIGAIIMEPQRSIKPDMNFLKLIRKITKENNIPLIFDEITSAFHDNFGGIHLKLKVYPDIAVFSKALGNGTPISAIVGKKKIMDCAQDTFISSTMWTERIGFVAALETLRKMKEKKVQEKIVKNGLIIKNCWLKIAKKFDLKIQISGMDSMPSFNLDYKNSNELHTYFTQEMLNKGFLATNSVTVSFAHNSQIINKYLKQTEFVFKKIKKLLDENSNIPLKNKPRDLNFTRLVK